MSFASLVAALLLLCALFPGPLLGIEERYTWALSRMAARLSDGALDDQTAFRRIRRGEVINPRTSVRIFSLSGFLLAVLSRAFSPETTMLPHVVVFLFAIVAAGCAARADFSLPARLATIVLGVLCIIAVV
jgi:hypothetical protein